MIDRLRVPPHLQGFYQLALLESRWIHQKLRLRDFNTIGGFVEDTIGVFISTITK
jgi:hypothetical protein